MVYIDNLLQDWGVNIRGEVAAFACEDGDIDIFTLGYLSHETRKVIVEVLREGIELVWQIEGDDCNLALGG